MNTSRLNISRRSTTRWGARAVSAITVAALASAALPGAAQAAEASSPFVVGGASAVQAGSTIRISYPAYRLLNGEQTIGRTVHARIVSTEQDCAGSSISLAGSTRSIAVPFQDRNSTFTLEYPIPSIGTNPRIETYFVCAYEKGQVSPDFANVDSPYVTWRILPGTNTAAVPALPATPSIVNGTTADGVPTAGSIQVAAGLLSAGPSGDQATRRVLRKSTVAAPDVDSCANGSNVTELDLAPVFGLRSATANVTVTGAVGQYLCLDQILATTSHPQPRTSPPLVVRITGQTPTGIPAGSVLSVAAAIARAQAATQRLVDLNARGGVSAAEAAAALQEAQAADDALQAAQAAAANNDPAAPDAAQAGAGASDAVISPDAGGAAAADANDALRQQLESAIGGTAVNVAPGVAPTLLSLAAVTGFDPLATPVLGEGKGNASGISLKVTKPKSITRGKGFSVTLNVDPKTTRGGMRQYLLRMDGDQPTLVHKRSGFISQGSRSKRYWLSPKAAKGSYALLSTFQPSVPGTPGLSIVTPLTVR